MTGRSPESVARIAATFIAISSASALILLFWLTGILSHWGLALALFLIVWVTSFVVVRLFMRRYVQSRLRILYRTMHSLSSAGKEQGPRTDDPLSQANEDLMDWAKSKIQEIKTLRENENFRREFAGNLAHELKTPVFNIQGYIDTLIENENIDRATAQNFLQKAARNTERMAGLIKDLDLISRAEAGSLNLRLQSFDIVELTRRTIELTEPQAVAAGITLEVKADAAVFVEADYLQIEQVLTNLIQNSIAYSRPNGKTTVSFFDLEENILVEVADNGIGISREHLPRVFERFYRVDKSRSRNEGGSGLGLAICKHIIESHGHSIQVQSKEGQGSVFSFTLGKGQPPMR
ncbi:MAG: sensor histidine kinase [Flavobacteriales bacterium]|nr:sensor histidine kinase [Flavobacteriales bacterium]